MTHHSFTTDRRSFLAGTAATAGSLLGLAGTAAAADGQLLVGTTSPGRVYRQDGDGWTQLGDDLTDEEGSVIDLVVHDGTLFAGTTTQTRSNEGDGEVYRWTGTTWTQVGGALGNTVNSLVIYDGALHAGVSEGAAEVYRLDDDDGWTQVVNHEDWTGTGAMAVYDGVLYLGDLTVDLFGRYDGETFTQEADREGSCIYDFEVFDGDLYAGAYRGRLFRRDGGDWTTVDQADAYGDLLTVAEHDDTLFVGSTVFPGLFRLEEGGLTRIESFEESVVALFGAGDALYVGLGQNAGEFADSNPQATVGELYRYAEGSIEQVAADQDFAGAVQTITTLAVNEPPTAAITVETDRPVTGEPIDLSGADSTDPDGDIESYEWDLDDDGTFEATGETVETTLESPGEQSITLRVTDDDGATATTTATIDPALGVDIAIKPDEEPTPINLCRTNGVLPVAIDGDSVDPETVDVSTIRVGPPEVLAAGDGASPIHDGHVTDVTGSDTPDLVVHVPMAETGFDDEDSLGALEGTTTDGTTILGTDEITIVNEGCEESN